MKRGAIRMNSRAIARGEAAWIDGIPGMEDLRLKVRAMGNDDFQRRYDELSRAIPRTERDSMGRLSPEQDRRLTARIYCDTILCDWAGFTEDDGTPVPFSTEEARTILDDPDFADFAAAVGWAARKRAADLSADTEAAAGN